jgi:hypothetical protein
VKETFHDHSTPNRVHRKSRKCLLTKLFDAGSTVRILDRWFVVVPIVLGCVSEMRAEVGVEFFEKNIRPVLVEHCYPCHSAESKELKGELRLDVKAGGQLGGKSGEPAVVPGKPDESPLIRAVRHDVGASAMPPNKPRLSDRIVVDHTEWVQRGAPDPREGSVTGRFALVCSLPDRRRSWRPKSDVVVLRGCRQRRTR